MTTSQRPEANWQAEAGIGGYGERPTGWAAYIVFAAVLLAVVGVFSVVQGLTALLDDEFYLVRPGALALSVGYPAWGWTHLALGVVAIVTGWGLQRGNPAARVVAVVFAVVNAVVNLVFLPAYPWWCGLLIAFDVLVVYAVTVHGQAVRAVH